MNPGYKSHHAGVYAEGIYGHRQARITLARLIASEGGPRELVESLEGPGPEDLYDEDQALDFLQRITIEGLTWKFELGDLVLRGDDQL